jgi:hypothetical protein
MVNKIVLAFVVGSLAAALAGITTYEHAIFRYVVAASALLGAVIGWQWASQQNVRRAIELTETSGGIEAALDRSGREMLTLWIPLDHEITEADRSFAKQFGKAFAQDVSRSIAGFCAIESSFDAVGITLIGRDADIMLHEIRTYFSSRCPRGSFITRRRVTRAGEYQNSQPILWPGGKPLFEDEVLPQAGNSGD